MPLVDEGAPASGTISIAPTGTSSSASSCTAAAVPLAARHPVCRLGPGPVCLSSSVCLPVCRLSPVVCLVVWASCMGGSRGGVPLPWASACVCFGLPVAPPLPALCVIQFAIVGLTPQHILKHMWDMYGTPFGSPSCGFLLHMSGFSIAPWPSLTVCIGLPRTSTSHMSIFQS